jgi:hypothetical protein
MSTPPTKPGSIEPPESQLAIDDVARQRTWLLVVLICLASAWPDLVLNRIAYPLTRSLARACFVTLGVQALLAALVGHVGGRAKDWHMTSFGIIAMAILPFFGDFIYDSYRGSGSASLRFNAKTLLGIFAHFSIAALFASVAHLLTEYGSRPIPPGLCRQCRYNLTGNVSGKCPECGTPVKRDGSEKIDPHT